VQGEHNTRLEYSTNFFAVLHQIKKLDCVSCDIFQLSEVPIQVRAFRFPVRDLPIHIRIRLITLMRIRIQLLIKVNSSLFVIFVRTCVSYIPTFSESCEKEFVTEGMCTLSVSLCLIFL
jgi:hypothetical protein